MKKLFSITAVLLSFSLLQAQSIVGDWEGALDANGTELTVVFHIAKDSTGKLVGSFDSPKQMAYGLKCSNISMAGDSVLIEMKAFGAKYSGLVGADKKTMTGNWGQGGITLPLELVKTGDVAVAAEMKRPQTPKPPFSYHSEEVSYGNADNSIRFGGTFTRPSLWADKVKEMKYPVVILITGSGQQDRDETLFEHKPFAVIADHLAKQGIATLRVDDREKGKTTGKFMTSTTLDFAKALNVNLNRIVTTAQKQRDQGFSILEYRNAWTPQVRLFAFHTIYSSNLLLFLLLKEKFNAAIRLWADMEILAEGEMFLGSLQSNIVRMVLLLRIDKPANTSMIVENNGGVSRCWRNHAKHKMHQIASHNFWYCP